jgi:large subunit ribosomal protein L21
MKARPETAPDRLTAASHSTNGPQSRAGRQDFLLDDLRKADLNEKRQAMFAIVRTGGKQYRVAAGDKIVVEKLAGEAGDKVTLDDVLLAGDGGDLKDTAKLTVAAEIIAQAKGEKVIVFKKRRRHNYRRKNGHRQNHTILKIVSIGA